MTQKEENPNGVQVMLAFGGTADRFQRIRKSPWPI